MRTSSKEKRKTSQLRAVEDVVFSTKMTSLDFEPTREEETFLQLIGLDKFVTKVTWKIMNTSVVEEVIANLNLDTIESTLNVRGFYIFSKDWKNKMRAIINITIFPAKREPCTPKVKTVKIFSSYHDKMRTKAETYKITNCTILEARRHLRFFNSIFSLKTSANTISCSIIIHIIDTLNGKLVDWPALFCENLMADLWTLKYDYSKVKPHGWNSW